MCISPCVQGIWNKTRHLRNNNVLLLWWGSWLGTETARSGGNIPQLGNGTPRLPTCSTAMQGMWALGFRGYSIYMFYLFRCNLRDVWAQMQEINVFICLQDGTPRLPKRFRRLTIQRSYFLFQSPYKSCILFAEQLVSIEKCFIFLCSFSMLVMCKKHVLVTEQLRFVDKW